jgi:hypothetical protein
MHFSFDPEHLGEDVKTLFTGAESVTVVAPFITKPGLLPLIDVIAPTGAIDIVTRWDPYEIRAGASDPMVIEAIEATGGSVRLLPQLHAKVYAAGELALVGSANATGPGLGFAATPNVETLVPISRDDPALLRLFETIDALAARVDLEYAMKLVQYAAALPAPPPSEASIYLAIPSARWIPQTMVPKRVLECYEGLAERDDYRADLTAIAAPPGLSPEEFRGYVGLVLLRGLIGRVCRNCEGLQQWEGIERMLDLLKEAQVPVTEEPLRVWNRLRNWFTFYLDATVSLNGGYTISQ